MKFLWKMILLPVVLFVPLLAGAASLLNLEINFENDAWREFLLRQSGRKPVAIVPTDRGKALELPPGTSLQTVKFPYHRGEIHVAAELENTEIAPGARPYHVGWVSVDLFDADGKALGHRDLLNSGRPSGWKVYRIKVVGLRRDAAFFQVSFRNFGRSGVLRVRRASIRLELPGGSALCGDPGFRGDFAVDHRHYVREGVDWDGLALKSPAGRAEYVTGAFPDGGKSLKITGNATFRTSRYAYDGEALLFGGWAKYANRTRGSREWAWSNLQLVLFDRAGKKIGHRDLTPLERGELPWRYFSTLIPEGSFRRDTAGFEIWARGFEGSKGESFFDEVQILRFNPENGTRRRYDASAATLRIDPGKAKSGPIRPVWNGTDISYAEKIASPVVRNLLADLRKNGVEHLRLREFLQGCRILSRLDEAGNPIYDWTMLDSIIDWAVREQKFKLTATMESTPNQLSTKPAKNPRVFCNRSVPRDFRLWGRVVRDTIEHWIERYGLETVEEWEFECWNEPFAQRYYQGSNEEFLKIFEAYADALTSIEKKYGCRLKIGTFSGIGESPISLVVLNGMKEKGKLGVVNVISSHIYAGFVNSFDALERGIRSIRAFTGGYPELRNASMLITEFNGSSMGNPYTDSAVAAAFYVKACRVFLDTGVERGYYFGPVDYMYSARTKYFTGDLGMFTKNGIPKPSFGSQQLLNRLAGGRRIAFDSSNEPLDGIAVADGAKLKLLLTTFDEARFDRAGTIEVKAEVSDTRLFSRCTLFRIDRKNANSHAKWRSLGKPEISPATDAVLREAARLVPERFEAFRSGVEGLRFRLALPLNSVCYLEFE